MGDGRAVLAFASRNTATARVQVLERINTLVVSRAVEASLGGDRAGVQTSWAQGDVAAEVAALLVSVVVSSASTSATLVGSLRWLGVAASRRSGVLLAAPRTSGPGVSRLARRLRRVLVGRSAASLVGVPVPVALGAVTRARRSGRGGGSSVIQAAAQLRVPKLVLFAAGASLNNRRSGNEADKGRRNGNDASKRLHTVGDLDEDTV